MRIFGGVVLSFFAILSFQAQYRFDQWTTDDGLPQNSVFSILQTNDGYVWFTTLDGLVRFDGVKFKVFNRSNSPGLTSNRLIYLFAKTDDNGIWVGTEDSGLLRFQNGEFRSFTTEAGLASNKINKIFCDFDNQLLIAAQSGLSRFDGEKFIPENRIEARDYGLYFAPSGVRWQLDKNGLTAEKNGEIKKYELPFRMNQITGDRAFNFPGYVEMLEDKNQPGTLWLTAAESLYHLENGKFTAFSAAEGMPKSIVRAIAQEENGDIWMGTEKNGLCRFSNNKINCFTKNEGLSSNSIWSLLIDREKTLWAATSERGINRVSRQVITPLSKKEGIQDSNIYPILEDSKGNFWIGTWTALSVYKNGEIKNYDPRSGLLYEIVQSLFEDKNGRIWIGSVGGVQYFENGKFVDFTEKLGLTIGVNDFWDIHQTPDGAMWFATNLGLLRYENGNVTKFTVENGLPANDVKKILSAKDGSIWFGTVNGLARFIDGKFEVFREKDGLSGNHVRTIYEDAEGLLWIGTYDSGLTLFRNGKFAKITMENGLFSNGVFQILPDDRGNFWLSSNQGIYRVNRLQLINFADGKSSSIVSTAFGKSDGMLNTECNGGRQPAGIRASDGKLWFPTQDGVAIVNPEIVPFNSLPPPIVIEAIRIDENLLVPIKEKSSFFETENFSVTVQPGQEKLEIDYTGLSFIKSEQIRFRYRLEGLDSEWTEAGTRRTAFYPYLPPGNYTFRVMAANSDNVWNEQGATLSIVVKPAFYQTWYFLIACFLIVLLIVYAIYRLRISRLERARIVQEEFSRRLIAAHESERRRIAAGLHDSLGQTLAMIKNRAVFAVQNTKNLDAAKTEFDQITEQSVYAINEVREISYNLRPYLLDRLGLTKALKSLFNKTAENSNLEIRTEIENIDSIFTNEEEINLYRIVQESLNNILKHADARKVKVEIGKTNNFLNIKIEDDGKGFSTDGALSNNKKEGFGLLGIAERIKILGGTHSIESVQGKGTIINFKIDISRKINSNGKADQNNNG